MIYVTIVGAGHYGKDLIAIKYKENRLCKLKAVISPTVHKDELLKSPLSQTPLYRSPKEWKAKNGKANSKDLFDLCVHHKILPILLKSLVEIGAKNFVLSKPIATNRKNLDRILKLKRKHKLKIAIASQWYYSELTNMAKSLISEIKRKSVIDKVIIDFGQFFSNQQLKDYSVTNSLLPHMLQIMHSTGINGLNNKFKVQKLKGSAIRISYQKTKYNPKITVVTDIRSRSLKRIMEIYADNKPKPELTVDFFGIFKKGKAIKYPSITYGKKSVTIKEDNLRLMTDKIVTSFSNNNVKDSNKNILTLNKYLPIAKHQVDIERKV